MALESSFLGSATVARNKLKKELGFGAKGLSSGAISNVERNKLAVISGMLKNRLNQLESE